VLCRPPGAGHHYGTDLGKGVNQENTMLCTQLELEGRKRRRDLRRRRRRADWSGMPGMAPPTVELDASCLVECTFGNDDIY
jgi:hypothetical protein